MEKRFGTYPGSLKGLKNYLKNCTQLELFLIIENKMNYIRLYYNYKINDNWETVLEELYALDYAMMFTRRFGVQIFKSNNENLRVSMSDSFIIWLYWCREYIDSHYTKQKLKIIRKKIVMRQDVSKFEIPRMDKLINELDDNKMVNTNNKRYMIKQRTNRIGCIGYLFEH